MGYQTSYGHAGDPFLGGLLKGAIGAIGGGIKGALGSFGIKVGGSRTPVSLPGGRFPISIAPPQVPALPVPGMKGTIQRMLPGGQSGYMSAGIPKGYRLNKTGYWTKDGYVAPGTKLVKVRYRNPANAKALRRALSRAEAFGGLVKRARKTTRRLKTI